MNSLKYGVFTCQFAGKTGVDNIKGRFVQHHADRAAFCIKAEGTAEGYKVTLPPQGETRSDEWVAKMVDGIKSAWSDPEKRAARLAKLKATRERKKLQEGFKAN
jgi:hypothetical protein